MEFDFTTLPAPDRYRLLTNFVVPRPIALVSTRSPGGANNAAPMSFFNVFSQEPPLLILGIQGRCGEEKDTLANIRREGAFVVNMVDMSLAEAMIVCGVNFEAGIDEIAFAGLTAVPGVKVPAPRIAESPSSMECRVERIPSTGRTGDSCSARWWRCMCATTASTPPAAMSAPRPTSRSPASTPTTI